MSDATIPVRRAATARDGRTMPPRTAAGHDRRGLRRLARHRRPQDASAGASSSPRSCFFALGGVLAALMRLQLAVPDNALIGPDRYNQLFTTHGTTMMFLFAVPSWPGDGASTSCR